MPPDAGLIPCPGMLFDCRFGLPFLPERQSALGTGSLSRSDGFESVFQVPEPEDVRTVSSTLEPHLSFGMALAIALPET